MNFNETIKNRREQLGFTQDDVAKHLHVTRQTISKWELGKSYPDLDLLVTLSELYDLSLDELIKGNKQIIQFFNKDSKATKKQQLINSLIALSVWTFFLVLLTISWLTQSPERIASKKLIFLLATILNSGLFLFSIIQTIKIFLHKENIYIEEKKKTAPQYHLISKKNGWSAVSIGLMTISLWCLQYDSIHLSFLIPVFSIGFLSTCYAIWLNKQSENR